MPVCEKCGKEIRRGKRCWKCISKLSKIVLVSLLLLLIIASTVGIYLIATYEPKPFVKEKLKITTVNKLHGEVTKDVYVKAWRPLNMVDILLEGYAFRYEVESDLVTYKDYGIESDYLRGVEFDRWLKVYLRKPIFETEVPLYIEVWDYETLESIIEFRGWNELTVTIEWEQA